MRSCSPYLVLEVEGGGGTRSVKNKFNKDKEAKEEEPTAPRWVIPDLETFTLNHKVGDAAAVTSTIDVDEMDMVAMVKAMPVDTLESLAGDVEKYKKYGFRDTSLRAYGSHLPLMQSLKDCRQIIGE